MKSALTWSLIIACFLFSSSGFGQTPGNLALNQPARQSSTGFGGEARLAVDGNNDGRYAAGSITHTRSEREAWWEVDLGRVRRIDSIVIWNRTDGTYGNRLSDFFVLVSERPFPSTSLEAAKLGPAVWSHHHPGAAGRQVQVPVRGNGRFVRIQLQGTNYLSLAEVEVFGAEPAAPQPPVATPRPAPATPRPVDVAGSWSAGGGRQHLGRIHIWQDGQRFTVIAAWPESEAAAAAGIWKSYKGEGVFRGRQMEFKVYPSCPDGRSADQGYVYHWTVSDDNSTITGHYTRHGRRMRDGDFVYHRVR